MDTLYNWLGILVFYAILAIACMAVALGVLFFLFMRSSDRHNHRLVSKNEKTQFVINQEKAYEHRERFLWFFKKTVLRIRDEARGNPIYLIRYSLFSCRWFAVKVHKICLSDDDCAHDHPWSFISVILRGGYWEHTPFPYPLQFWYGPGSILWRKAPSPHRLELPEGKTALTLVITFKRSREWGFYTSQGWIMWKNYIRSGAKC